MLNAVQGAMAMAVWAVPRVEPWIEILRDALAEDHARVAKGTEELGSQWFQFPWLVEKSAVTGGMLDEQRRLWQAALSCLQWPIGKDMPPAALAEKIATTAVDDAIGASGNITKWLDQIRSILGAPVPFTPEGGEWTSAGLAVGLVLLRSDPERFRSWAKELPCLSPAVWWAAAVLCGWRNGYRELGRNFRGNARFREFLSSRYQSPSQHLPLGLTQEEGFFTLIWRGHHVFRHAWRARAKWYNAELTDDATRAMARELANRLGWSCHGRRVNPSEANMQTDDNGLLPGIGEDIADKGPKLEPVPVDVDMIDRFDPDAFRQRLITAAGVVSDPPESVRIVPPTGVPGLVYWPGFVTEDEEKRLLACIDAAEWSGELRRRVQHYGWRYDYRQRQIDQSMRVGELPPWALELAQRLTDEGLMKDLPDQVIVNEYLGNQGISRHIDQPQAFTDQIATVSLLETWCMVFRHKNRKEKVEKPLERGSVAVLSGEARYKWTHEIPQRSSEPLLDGQGKCRWVERSRRISLTFRKTCVS